MTLPAYIPGPSGNGVPVGPLYIHFYGLAYVFAITAAALFTRRCGARKAATPARR